MRLSLAQTVALGIVAVACGGCPSSMDETRTAGTNKVTFTSGKAPDAVAGCIASALSTSGTEPAATQITATGWTVHKTTGAWTAGLVDVARSGTGSAVTYTSQFSAQTGNFLPAIKGCL